MSIKQSLKGFLRQVTGVFWWKSIAFCREEEEMLWKQCRRIQLKQHFVWIIWPHCISDSPLTLQCHAGVLLLTRVLVFCVESGKQKAWGCKAIHMAILLITNTTVTFIPHHSCKYKMRSISNIYHHLHIHPLYTLHAHWITTSLYICKKIKVTFRQVQTGTR